MTSFLSVGIDVGTTSTHLTFSRLTVVNVAPVNQSPLAKIEKRELIFQSEIHITPLTCDGNIDAAAVYELIAKEYEKAAINRDDIKIGAAIITGETALKRNAREVIEKLCALSGDLVAVGAGPHMEALLSARGSGAAEASRQCRTTILNVDIGGGTMNLALYQNGAIVSTHCLGIGGRCVQLKRRNEAEFDVVSMTQGAKEYLQSHVCESLALKVSDLRQLANSIASDVVSFINQDPEPTVLKKLPLTSIENAWTVPDEIWLSGGVAEFAVDEQMNRFEFCDLGGLLCDALVAKLNSSKINFKIPTEPIRATVMGAGMYSMQVSGSTIDFDINCLPLRNVPLVRPFRSCDELLAEDVVAERMLSAIIRIDPDMRRQTIAIELPSMETVKDYPSLKKIAGGLAKAAKNIAGLEPFVLIVREDLGMALGQLIRRAQDSSNKTCPLIVLDGITTSDGDFIDVGRPVSLDGNEIARTLPVVLKTLVFERDR